MHLYSSGKNILNIQNVSQHTEAVWTMDYSVQLLSVDIHINTVDINVSLKGLTF